MFIINKYKIWYDSIITRAKNRKINGYVEKHHIIPRCVGGIDNESNIVQLTAREHFICHRLLVKFTTGKVKRQMLHALGMFIGDGKNTKRNLSSIQYEIARKSISQARIGRKHSDETRKKISESRIGKLPWNKGLVGVQSMNENTKNNLSLLYKNKTYEERFGDKSEIIKNKISKSKIGHKAGMTGKKHSEETRKKMGENMRGKRGPQKRYFCSKCEQKDKTTRHIKFCDTSKKIDKNKKYDKI